MTCESQGFVVRAETEQQAREIVHHNAGEETRTSAPTDAPWLDLKILYLQAIAARSWEGVIIRDHLSP
jgi:capsular polysaccharide biosynthesis protein